MKDLNEFLAESNAIEDVYDDESFNQAKYAWEYLIEQKKLTIGVILKTHKILMLHQKLLPNQKGYLREVAVFIGNKEALHYSQIRLALDGWLKLMNDELTTRDWKKLHVMYEGIHPFIDGNGRTGRMFLNWQRRQAGLPILVIEADKRWEYYDWFK